MKRLLAVTTAAAALMFAGSAGYAQDLEMPQIYVMQDSSGQRMVMTSDNPQGSSLLVGEAGAVPGDCPAGSFYETESSVIIACGDDTAMFDLQAPEAGAMMMSGEAFPQGAMVGIPRESGEQKQGDTTTQ